MAERILVVEDDTITRTHISDTLRDKGYEVDEVRDGVQAIDLLNVQPFDLVITDFVMPNLDGLKLTERIHSTGPETSVIFMTAYLSPEPARVILGDTAEVLPKPIETDHLLSMIHRLLG